ncbi:MAG: signal recognition particle receptor subunit alpha, partial [Phenylobacterium sp.]
MTEPKKGWFQRLADGLSRSSKAMTEQVVGSFTKQPLDEDRLDELEEMLIEADLGPYSAARIRERFAEERFGKSADEREIKEGLAAAIG